MFLLKLIAKNLLARPLATFLSFLLFSLGISLAVLVSQFEQQFSTHFENNTGKVTVVVGAKGSPLQLVLSSIYHVDAPTGNISMEKAMKLKKHPLVKMAVPISLGDNVEGYRIVGTNEDFFSLYGLEMAEGALWGEDMEVVLGASVAKALNYQIGTEFHGSHGMGEGEEHDHAHFVVKGILKPSQSVVDQLILCNLSTYWEMHKKPQVADSLPSDSVKKEEKEITALLLVGHNAMAALNLPKQLNKGSAFQAAVPSLEMTRLLSLLGFGFEGITWFSYGLLFFASLGLFLSLLQSLNSRRYELGLLRVLGAKRFQVFALVIGEALLLGFLGFIGGELLGRSLLLLSNGYLEENYHYSISASQFISKDAWLLVLTLLAALLSGLIPAIKAYRKNIQHQLMQ